MSLKKKKYIHNTLHSISMNVSQWLSKRNHNLRVRTIWTVMCTTELFLSRHHMQITSEQESDV